MRKDKRWYYITPEDYEEAERRGISKKTLNDRVRRYDMDVETAINKPLRTSNSFDETWEAWKDVCESNGISRRLFYHRLYHGKTHEDASTREIKRGGNRRKEVM